MRAKEFVINVPISIRIDGNGDPELDMGDKQELTPPAPAQPVISKSTQPKADNELEDQPMMVSPLQQEIELKKAELGKDSPIIQNLRQDEYDADAESDPLRNIDKKR